MRTVIIAFPGTDLPCGSHDIFFLSYFKTNTIEELDEMFMQMSEFVKNADKIIAIVPKKYKLDILAYLGPEVEFHDIQ